MTFSVLVRNDYEILYKQLQKDFVFKYNFPPHMYII